MTTVEKDHGFAMFCKGKSNRSMYTECCSNMGIKRNSALADELNSETDCFDMRKLDLSGNYLGGCGIKALVDVVQANKCLEEINYSQQGINAEVLGDLLEVVRSHPRITSLDLSHNKEIGNHCAPLLLDIAKQNTLLYSIDVSGSRIAKPYQKKLEEYTARNKELETSFFKGDYLRMKKLFSTVDTDGSGHITPKELLNNIDIQQVVITLTSFLEMDGEDGVKDHAISINEFLNHVYPNYKSVQSIVAHSRKEDTAENNINKNYVTIAETLRKRRVHTPHVRMLRVHDCLLTPEQLNSFVDEALTIESTSGVVGEVVDGRLSVSYPSLKAGLRKVWNPPSSNEERAQFKMSPTLTRHIIHFFDKRGIKTQFNSTPRVRMTALMEGTFQTSLVKLHLKLMVPFIQKHSIDLDTMSLTLQETIAMIEEYYDLLAFDKGGDREL
eukprot:TRINITY_DN30921_c0_g1_i1.p1 TRINITY_DN30921_c0_g1~~TRINITY_DN30921_c0_g1_i1.p1  ORF type:complete len:457 (+),score=74.93 TRINITY_DN30921_c0_g1_i1:49-1371(+)